MNKEHWQIVLDWLQIHGYVNDDYEEIEVTDDGLYCYSESENTFYSIFTTVGDLVFYVGCKKPRISIGGKLFIPINSPYDVIDFLIDNLDDYLQRLDGKLWDKKS